MNFRYKLMQFMYGRYGVDTLFYYLLGTSIVLSVINIFTRSMIVQIIVYALIVYALFRTFSKNLEARRRENYWFDSKIKYFKKKKEFNDQVKSDKCHIYKKCPNCKAILRLPKREGTHTTICPKCQHRFTVKVKKGCK